MGGRRSPQRCGCPARAALPAASPGAQALSPIPLGGRVPVRQPLHSCARARGPGRPTAGGSARLHPQVGGSQGRARHGKHAFADVGHGWLLHAAVATRGCRPPAGECIPSATAAGEVTARLCGESLPRRAGIGCEGPLGTLAVWIGPLSGDLRSARRQVDFAAQALWQMGRFGQSLDCQAVSAGRGPAHPGASRRLCVSDRGRRYPEAMCCLGVHR
mmetsp:Transcript_51833/g.133872  ORF Transcript_51833/g.133872 Transcript_51833/m.133872 type:complete len:216 (+) Transcript_51833:84-731(+)